MEARLTELAAQIRFRGNGEAIALEVPSEELARKLLRRWELHFAAWARQFGAPHLELICPDRNRPFQVSAALGEGRPIPSLELHQATGMNCKPEPEPEPEPHQEISLYGQETLSFEPSTEELEQFILTQQQGDRIVTMLDLSLPVPQFVRVTSNQVWERNEGGALWTMGDWLKPETFAYIWRESMKPASRRRIDERYTLQAMEERLDPETGSTELLNYLYCCTAPNGDVRIYQSDVRLLLLPVGPRPSDRHLVRMMVSDRIENNPRAWEVLLTD